MTSSSRLTQQFAHNKTYGILICKTCQYAIQKSALKSHLLRHKIYREEQQRLLSLLVQLNLLEPDEVKTPSPESLPIEHLAVFPGFKCQLTSCGYLCISTKRMKNHWREVHPDHCCTESEMINISLQTFFRGTKIRYFEVKSQVSSNKTMHGTGSGPAASSTEKTPFVPVTPRVNEGLALGSSAIDLEALRYFHHFTTIACHTLPNENAGFWQKELIMKSLHSPWLMFGLLAISAHHILISSDDVITRQSCWAQALHYVLEFQKGWMAHQRQTLVADSQALNCGARIACLLRCHHWNCQLLDTSPALSVGQRISLALKNIQGCYGNIIEIGEVEILSVNTEVQPIYIRVQQSSSQLDSLRNPTEILDFIQSLPQRLALSLGKPQDIQDVHSVLSAIALLADSISICISSERDDWKEMVQWLHATAEHFHTLILNQNAAALIVLFCWLMVFERIEQQYWFYHGTSRMIRQLISDALPHDPKIQSLIELLQ